MKREIKNQSTNLKKGGYKRNELEMYGFGKDEIELIMKYQKQFPELLSEVDEYAFVIDGEVLCGQLEVKSNYNDWLLRSTSGKEGKLIKYRMVKNVDYTCYSEKSETQRSNGQRGVVIKNKIMLTLNCAKKIALRQNNEQGDLVCDYFILIEKAFRNRLEWNFDRDDTITWHTKLKQALIIHRQKLVSHKNFPEFAHNNVYVAESCMLNEVIIGMCASEYKKINGLGKNDAIRNTFTEEQLEYYVALQEYDADLINLQYMYDIAQRKEILERKYKSM